MAKSSCPKCDKKEFESVNVRPAGSETPVGMIQCRDCGCVVGVVQHELAEVKAMLLVKFQGLGDSINSIATGVEYLSSMIKLLATKVDDRNA